MTEQNTVLESAEDKTLPSIPTASAAQRNRLGLHILIIAVISFGLLIPQIFVNLLLSDRQSNEYFAVSSMTEAWGGSQEILPPILNIKGSRLSGIERDEEGRTIETVKLTEFFVLPEEAHTEVSLETMTRYRGIYEALLYTAKVQVTGFYDFAALDEALLEDPSLTVHTDEPLRLFVSVEYPRGIESVESFEVNGIKLKAEPSALGSGFEAVLPPLSALSSTKPNFAITYRLKGSEGFTVTPAAVNHSLLIAGSGVIPSFTGAFLPDERQIDEAKKSFSASYEQSFLATGIPRLSTSLDALDTSAISVTLHGQSEHYTLIERLTKYVLLVIALTFVTILTFEIADNTAVSLVQYVVVGAAILMFYLVLLALSEHLNFTLSYTAAALTLSLMIGLYLKGVFGAVRKALTVTILLLAVYALLFAIVHFETYALLVGTLLLTAMLGVVMYITRRLNSG